MSTTEGYRTRSKNPVKAVKLKEVKNRTLFEYPQGESFSRGAITFTEHDFLKLKAPQYLNDTVISFFMQYYLDKHVSKETKDRVHLFSSFFFAKLQSLRSKPPETYDESFKCISRWLKGVEIFKKDFLVMPVCDKDHWILVIVCYPDRTPSSKETNFIQNSDLYEPAVLVLNSWNGYAPGVKKSLNRFLKFQWLRERKNPRQFSIKSTSGFRLIFPRLPQQSNNYNCGVFTLNFFYCFMKNPRDSYLRMYRKMDLTGWFEENHIEITKERRRMTDVIKAQILLWKESEKERLQNNNSQEMNCSSSSQNCGSLIEFDDLCQDESTDSIPVIGIY